MTTSRYPTQENIIIPLLTAILRRGGRIVFSREGDAIEAELAEHFHLSPEDRLRTRPHINIKGKRVWRLHIQWARKKAVERRLIDGSIRDVWALTETGEKAAQAHS